MRLLAKFEILGVPAPQGSKTRMPNGAMIEGSSTTGRAKQKSWRAAVVETAHDVALASPYDGPLKVHVMFRMPMPASRPKRMRDAGAWPCSVKPDLDKLLRGLFDGLTAGGLIRDDARIYSIDATQVEVTSWTGAEVNIERWEP